ncbi:universal stress protein [Halalkalicoccus salilacus]
MYDHVLLPIDAAEHAFDPAERYGATLHVVHVVEAMSATATGSISS